MPQAIKRPTAHFLGAWMKHYIKVRGKWSIFTVRSTAMANLDFMLSRAPRYRRCAKGFFSKRAVGSQRCPRRSNCIDKSGGQSSCLQSLNVILKLPVLEDYQDCVQSKYLNNVVEQDQPFHQKKNYRRPCLVSRPLQFGSIHAGRNLRTSPYDPQGPNWVKTGSHLQAVCSARSITASNGLLTF